MKLIIQLDPSVDGYISPSDLQQTFREQRCISDVKFESGYPRFLVQGPVEAVTIALFNFLGMDLIESLDDEEIMIEYDRRNLKQVSEIEEFMDI